MCRELAFQAGGATDVRLNVLGPAGRARLLDSLERLLAQVREHRLSPTLLSRDGAPWDFTFFPVAQYGPLVECTPFSSFSELLDRFYEQREHLERVKQRGQDLIRSVTTARDRTARKIAHQEQELAATQDRERLRELGDILTSNLYQMERGMARLRTVDFYDPEGKEVDIQLDPLLTPQQNAAKYYKEYNKAKTAEVMLTQQLEKNRRELEYLNSVLDRRRIWGRSARSSPTPAISAAPPRPRAGKSGWSPNPWSSAPPPACAFRWARTTPRTTCSPVNRPSRATSGFTPRRSTAPT